MNHWQSKCLRILNFSRVGPPPWRELRSRDIAMNEYTLLCVDDDEAIRALYDVLLTSRGYKVIVAEGASRALQIIKAQPGEIDAVLMDYEMPGMNGADLAATVKRHNPDLPVVMITGNPSIAEKAPPCVDIILEKGANLSTILERVEILVTISNLRSKAMVPLQPCSEGAALD